MPDDDPLAGRLKKYLTDGAETGRTRTDRPNDLHTTRAAKVWGIAEKEVAPEQRQKVKNATFSFTYGMNIGGLTPKEPRSWTDENEEELILFLRRLFDVPDKLTTPSSSSST